MTTETTIKQVGIPQMLTCVCGSKSFKRTTARNLMFDECTSCRHLFNLVLFEDLMEEKNV